MEDGTYQDPRDVSRDNWMFPIEKPTLEHLRVGALMRIADSLEGIARTLVNQSPESIEERKKQKEFNARTDEVSSWLEENGVNNSGDQWRWSLAFAEYESGCGSKLDYTDKTSWVHVEEFGVKSVRGFGKSTGSRLAKWMSEKWPEPVGS